VIVLGIDPGTAALGWGLIERTGPERLGLVAAGCLETSPDTDLPERLRRIHAHVTELIARHGPQLVAVERLFFSRNAQTAFGVGQARGAVLVAAAEAGLPVREATPGQIKVAVTGHGGADKDQVGRMVGLLLGLAAPPRPDDTADALAVAIWAATAERTSTAPASSVLDRAAVAPIDRRGSPYERAVREALAGERGAAARRR
jgi:crossover junction endodeoxyribonuclease RuvC